jgi:hypothetical protein|eukprot:COSAG01_NODE_1132_length_11565_cov_84.210412_12_plen_179_part_00
MMIDGYPGGGDGVARELSLEWSPSPPPRPPPFPRREEARMNSSLRPRPPTRNRQHRRERPSEARRPLQNKNWLRIPYVCTLPRAHDRPPPPSAWVCRRFSVSSGGQGGRGRTARRAPARHGLPPAPARRRSARRCRRRSHAPAPAAVHPAAGAVPAGPTAPAAPEPRGSERELLDRRA